MTGSACTNAILQLFSMSFMAVDLSFLKISIRRAVRSLYYFVSGGFKRLYRFLVILLFDQKIVRIVSRYCKNRDAQSQRTVLLWVGAHLLLIDLCAV